MSATYVRPSDSDKDFVRFLIRDTVVASAMLQDEEIEDILDAETATGDARRYYAAATCLAALHTQWMSAGRGKTSKKVSRLTVVYGTGSGINIDIAIQKKISELRKEGARLLAPAPYAFRCL
jgi:hypothetical protein